MATSVTKPAAAPFQKPVAKFAPIPNAPSNVWGDPNSEEEEGSDLPGVVIRRALFFPGANYDKICRLSDKWIGSLFWAVRLDYVKNNPYFSDADVCNVFLNGVKVIQQLSKQFEKLLPDEKTAQEFKRTDWIFKKNNEHFYYLYMNKEGIAMLFPTSYIDYFFELGTEVLYGIPGRVPFTNSNKNLIVTASSSMKELTFPHVSSFYTELHTTDATGRSLDLPMGEDPVQDNIDPNQDDLPIEEESVPF